MRRTPVKICLLGPSEYRLNGWVCLMLHPASSLQDPPMIHFFMYRFFVDFSSFVKNCSLAGKMLEGVHSFPHCQLGLLQFLNLQLFALFCRYLRCFCGLRIWIRAWFRCLFVHHLSRCIHGVRTHPPNLSVTTNFPSRSLQHPIIRLRKQTLLPVGRLPRGKLWQLPR